MNEQRVFESVILDGQHVRLEPLNHDHKQGLVEAVKDGELWNLFVTLVPHYSALDSFIDDALTMHENGEGMAFATIDKQTGRVAGSTRFMKTDWANKKLEIGFTFLGKSWQKTAVNTEAKRLMLQHAFESLQFNRVELLTDYLNTASRNAILRLGAKQEGILRNHMVMPNGRVRDSMIFSIIENEWLGVKQNLDAKLASYSSR